MGGRNTRTLQSIALWLVGVHFLTVVLHSVAHEVLKVKATPAQLAFIVPVIVVAPVAAGLMLPKYVRGGAALLLASLAGSFVFGLYYHFVADTIDHVAHVAQMRPEFWSRAFRATAYALLVTEAAGALAALPLAAGAGRAFETHAARTGL